MPIVGARPSGRLLGPIALLPKSVMGPISRKREATMSEERLVDIEFKLAHQDQLLSELNDVVTKQQQKIMQIEELCGSLIDRVRTIGEALPADTARDERPPHY